MTYYSEKNVIIGYNNVEKLSISNSSTIQEKMPEDVLFRIKTTCENLENSISTSYKDDGGKLENFEIFLNQ